MYTNDQSEVINLIFELINSTITNKEVAKQFILEELEAMESSKSIQNIAEFLKKCGYTSNDWERAMRNSWDEVDGPNGPQQAFMTITMDMRANNINKDIIIGTKICVVDKIMKYWKLGKYEDKDCYENLSLQNYVSKKNKTQLGIFANMGLDLNECEKNIESQPSSLRVQWLYAYMIASAGMFFQAAKLSIDPRDLYVNAYQILQEEQKKYEDDKETYMKLKKQAMDFILSYDNRFTEKKINALADAVYMKVFFQNAQQYEYADEGPLSMEAVLDILDTYYNFEF